MSYLQKYLAKNPENIKNGPVVAYLASIDSVMVKEPIVGTAIVQELKDQRSFLKLIASENYSSLEVQLAMGNLLTDKYSEGIPGKRFYSGCENVDHVEALAVERAKKIFCADHAYVQPHSGSDANLVALWAILLVKVQDKEIERLGKKTLDELTEEEYQIVRQKLCNQKMMGLSLNSGGHLTHGYRHNISSKILQSIPYEVNPETGLIDYIDLAEKVKETKPLILIAGYSAYPRLIDFEKMREIADSVDAVLMVDMAHFAGLVAGGVLKGAYNPIPYADIVTTTTHKTLRGPRGGMVLCTKEYQEAVNKGCPLVLGGPLPHVMAAKAVAFGEIMTREFSEYSHQVVRNAKALAQALVSRGVNVLTGGTDNHLLVVDTQSSFGLTGRQAETSLRDAGLTVNRNSIPNDINGPWYTSGIRLGTPALTTLGMKEGEMEKIGEMIFLVLKNTKAAVQKDEKISRAKGVVALEVLKEIQESVHKLLDAFPLYPQIEID